MNNLLLKSLLVTILLVGGIALVSVLLFYILDNFGLIGWVVITFPGIWFVVYYDMGRPRK